MVNIPKDFKEFIKLLNENNVKYLLVGGYAMAFYDQPRSTGDIDFYLEASKENAAKILKCLKDFGFKSLEITMDDLIEEDQVIQLGYPPLRINLLTSIDGVLFNDAWKSSSKIKLDDLSVNLIDKEHLITNKKASGRLQDLADIEKLSQ
ncbi:MAG: nucleotidyltransferase [Spirochaetaceae bacterium]|jgi:hypothetical protein|nr:nucleotidyltransferase [Spirochaetaceae bacterium]